MESPNKTESSPLRPRPLRHSQTQSSFDSMPNLRGSPLKMGGRGVVKPSLEEMVHGVKNVASSVLPGYEIKKSAHLDFVP